VAATVQLTCMNCGKDFERSLWTHRSNLRRGRSKFYCSHICAGKDMRVKPKVKTESTRIQTARSYSMREICPECNEKAVAVVETRKNSLGHRYRRKRCMACDHWFTTYEVPQDFYKMVTKPPEDTSSNSVVNKCLSCAHTGRSGCTFSLPEYLTSESYDCNHYVCQT
jgi:rRNA maturation protein Nop10